ncbi:MAG: pyridoxine 5'-phosphate synthase [Chlorobi bacterium]|nr:pyridoxine 5'-phosphate synthase [Chlorobiota bacterium]
MTKLSVNINKVATLRNTRNHGMPNILNAVKLCINAGCNGITIHPRPDERHIKKNDVKEVFELLKDYPNVEFNIEGNPFFDFVNLIELYKPTQCTLVPDSINTFTSNQGWDIRKNLKELKSIIKILKNFGCRVSLFVDPDIDQIALIPESGADRIELFTEPFADSFSNGDYSFQLLKFKKAALFATSLGIGINAGHDLDLRNLGPFLKNVPGVLEVSIGHALISDALEYGLTNTVHKYLEVIRKSNAN